MMPHQSSRYFRIDPSTGRLEPTARNQPIYNQAFEEESFASTHVSSNVATAGASATTKVLIGSTIFLGLAFITASIVIPLYLVPLLTLSTTVSAQTATRTTTTTTVTVTTQTTTTAVILYIPGNYYSGCNATCTNVTTVTPSTLLAFWEFENNLLDTASNFHGSMASGTTYLAGYVDQAVSIIDSQYVTINSPFLNLANRAFTVEAWIFLTSLNSTTDTAIFTQCQAFTVRNCLHYVIRSSKLYMGFFSDDTSGASNVSLNVWFHVAFVYNFAANTKSIYLDGILDGFGASGGAYQGSSGVTFIGYFNNSSPVNPLSGYMDQVSVSNRAKTACEVLNDATQVSHFSFDGNTGDVGPNTLTSFRTFQSNNGISFITGVVNQALMLSLSNSFFQACSYYSLSRASHPYSFALWINPSAPLGSILHLSTDRSGSGTWCLPIFGFSTNGSVVAQSWSGSSVVRLFGPQIPTSNWTHIVETWSSANGLRLYVNGDLYGSVNLTTFAASNAAPMCVFLGTSGFGINCQTLGILPGSYMGAIDEFYVYNRELTPAEVCPLAHP